MSQQETRQPGTRPMMQAEIDNLNREPLLKQDVTLKYSGNGSQDEYLIHADVILGGGGESDIYMASRLSDRKQFGAKLYRNMAVDEPKMRLRQELCDFIMAHSAVQTYHLLPIVAHAVVNIPSSQGTTFPKFIEIMPLLDDSNRFYTDGVPISPQEIRQKWLPQLATAMRTMHDQEWLHRDIKPQNLYRINGVLALGDFGTCCKLLPDVNAIHYTVLHAGTPGYVAPEVTSGYATKSTDCYSLGSTLTTLSLGFHYSRHPSINHSGNYALALARLNQYLGLGKLPFTTGDTAQDQLIMGLLQLATSQRYNLDDVKEYCFKKGWQPRQFRTNELLNVNFYGSVYTDKETLAQAMAQKWEQAKRYLYQGGVNNSSFVQNIRDHQGLGQFALDIITNTPSGGEDAGLARLLHKMNASLGICWQGKIFASGAAVAKELLADDNAAGSAFALVKSGVLPEILSTDNEVSKGTITGLREAAVNAKIAAAAQAARWMAVFLLGGDQGKTQAGLPASADACFAALSAGRGDPMQRLLQFPQDARQLAWLRIKAGCDIWLFLTRNSGTESERLVRVYQFLESYCADKKAVRAHYITKGPYGHLTWMQKNLHLYSFEGRDANAIKASISTIQLSDTLSIADLNTLFVRLNAELEGFRKLFQGNLLLAYLGYTCGKPILSKKIEAYFNRSRLGVDVPLGFLDSLNQVQAG